MGIENLRAAVLAGDEVFDHPRPERPRAVERHRGDDVFKAVGLEVLEELLHARRLQLEDPGGLSRLEQIERLLGLLRLLGIRVFGLQRNVIDVEGLTALRHAGELIGALANHRDGEVEHRQGGQSEEVELDQPGGLDFVLCVLRDRELPGAAEDRDGVPERALGDDDAGGVHAGVPVEVLQLHGHVDGGPGGGLRVVFGLELGLLLHRLLQRDCLAQHGLRDERGDGVHVREGHAHDAPDVAHAALGLEHLEGGNLPDGVGAILVAHILDDALALEHAEVDVEVGHRHALGIQEALEEEVIRNRVDVRDAQRIGHQRARAGPAARTDRDAVLLPPVDEVLDDQEVPGKFHPADDLDLGLQALAVFVRIDPLGLLAEGREALLQAFPAEPREELVDGLDDVAVGVPEVREHRLVELELELAHLRDAHAVGERPGHVAEDLRHLPRALQEHFFGLHPRRLGLVEAHARRDAGERPLRARVVALQVVGVVARHHGEVELLRELEETAVERVLLEQPVVLQLDEEVPRIEHLLEGDQRAARDVRGVLQQPLGDQPAEAAGHHHQALGVALEHREVGLRGDAFGDIEPGARDQRDEVAIALLGGRQHRQVIGAVEPVLVGSIAGKRVPEGHLAPENRLDARGVGLLIEVDRAMHVAVVGERHRRHAELLHPGAQFLHPDGAFQHRVLGVDVEMNELGL